MTRSTQSNPGAFTKQLPETLRSVLSRSRHQLHQRHWKGILYTLMTGSLNLVNQKLMRFRSPRFQCPCCQIKINAFIHKNNDQRIAWHSACPHCNSRSRHRGLSVLLPQFLTENPSLQRVLHVAPEPVLQPIFRSHDLIYHTTDRFLEDVGFPGENIESLSFDTGVYDLVLCNHVLEHVENDNEAVKEIARVLQPSGIAIVTIPGDWQRQKTIAFSNLTANGHYRDYGLDVQNLFLAQFSKVEMINLHDFDRTADGLKRGIRQQDIAFICYK